MEIAARARIARRSDRRRRRASAARGKGRNSRGVTRQWVGWGVRNGLQLLGGVFVLFVGFVFLFQRSVHRISGTRVSSTAKDTSKLPEHLDDRLRSPPPPPIPPVVAAAAEDHGGGDVHGGAVVLPPRSGPPPQQQQHEGSMTLSGARHPPTGAGDAVPETEPDRGRGQGQGQGHGPGGGGGGVARIGRGGVAGVENGGAAPDGEWRWHTPAETPPPVEAGGAFPDPAEDVELAFEGWGGAGGGGGGQEAGPMEKFLERGGKLPVVLMTCNRVASLGQTIESLRGVRGLDMSTVMVLQDGAEEQIAALVRREGLYLEQNTVTPGLRGNSRKGADDGARRIAMHYKYSLQHAFDNRPEAPGVIIVEDDLLFSPDFLEYLETNAPVLERDPSTLVLSAWNDNGYKGRVSDKAELKRTLYFPGLGWLLSRKLFNELRPRWPTEHWDHWLRDPKQHRGRECVVPEVPRTYHNGIKGTFMDKAMHDKLFKDIDYNLDPGFSWRRPPVPAGGSHGAPPPMYAKAMKENYERRMKARIRQARHINNLDELPKPSARREGEQVVMWYTLPQVEDPRPGSPSPFKPLADFFGIWHEYRRGEHLGMHAFRWHGHSYVMLINAAKSPYESLRPAELLPARMNAIRGGGSGAADVPRIIAGDRAGRSCDEICSAEGMACTDSAFELLNSCGELTRRFPCTTCAESFGLEQPCYVELDAPTANFPGQCLVSTSPRKSRCSASHRLTRRLCPCTAGVAQSRA